MRKAFTLAEIMIVLTIVGILTAIIFPIAMQSAPNENVIRFKKANATLGTVISELVNSDKYYHEGNLAVKVGNTAVSGTYFCKTFADVASFASTNCSVTLSGTATATAASALDTACNAVTNKTQLVAPGGIVFYETNTGTNFAASTLGTVSDGILTTYKIFCIDVDGTGPEAPFGYGIRRDGKIMYGTRAQEWINKSVQETN